MNGEYRMCVESMSSLGGNKGKVSEISLYKKKTAVKKRSFTANFV